MRLATIVAVAVSLTLSISQAVGGEPVKALLVTGGSSHDYDGQKKILTEGIGKRLNVKWTVADGGRDRANPDGLYAKGWADGFDVIVHNECFGGVVDDAFIEGIVRAHQSGTPGIFIHCSMHSYRNAKSGAQAWRELIGVTSKRHEKKKRQLVAVAVESHPTLAAFPEAWQTPNGELYVIDEIWPNTQPIVTAYSTEEKREMPVIWLNKLGSAKVFGTTLGHHNETMASDVWMDTVARGILWSLDKLPADGSIPDDFIPDDSISNEAASQKN